MKKRSWTIKQLKEACKVSYSMAQVMRALGLVPVGGNYSTMKYYINLYDIDILHFSGQSWLKGKTHNWGVKKPLEEILQKGIKFKSSHLRNRLIKEGVFKQACSNCTNIEWMGCPIPLELEHINGINNDNRIENLCLLCPNCHALTPTYR